MDTPIAQFSHDLDVFRARAAHLTATDARALARPVVQHFFDAWLRGDHATIVEIDAAIAEHNRAGRGARIRYCCFA